MLQDLTNIDSLIKAYIDDLDRKEITKDSYKRTLFRFRDYLCNNKLFSPKSRNVIEYKEFLSKKLGAAAIQKTVVVLRGFFEYLALNDLYPNILVGIRGAKVTKGMKRNTLQIDDLEKLISISKSKVSSITTLRDHVIFMLLCTTGLRTIEVERANIDDLSIIGDTPILYVQGKGRDDRAEYVKLSNEMISLIEEYLQARSDSYEPLFITHGHVSYGSRIRTRSIRAMVKELLYDADMYDKNVSAHSLRHFVCSEILRSGGSLEQAQQVLRHKDISTTQIYNHSLSRMDNNSELEVSKKVFMKEKENG